MRINNQFIINLIVATVAAYFLPLLCLIPIAYIFPSWGPLGMAFAMAGIFYAPIVGLGFAIFSMVFEKDPQFKKIIKSYEIAYPDPLILKIGDIVTIIKKEETPECVGWYFCKDQNGKEGWISKDFMTIEDSTGIMIKDYSAKEIAVEINDEVSVISESCGWVWCKKENGDEGWLPRSYLELFT